MRPELAIPRIRITGLVLYHQISYGRNRYRCRLDAHLRRIRARSDTVRGTDDVIISRSVHYSIVTVSSLRNRSHIRVGASARNRTFHSIAVRTVYLIPAEQSAVVTCSRIRLGRSFGSCRLYRSVTFVNQPVIFGIGCCHIYLRPETVVGKFGCSVIPLLGNGVVRGIVFIQQILPIGIIHNIRTDICIAGIDSASTLGRVRRYCSTARNRITLSERPCPAAWEIDFLGEVTEIIAAALRCRNTYTVVIAPGGIQQGFSQLLRLPAKSGIAAVLSLCTGCKEGKRLNITAKHTGILAWVLRNGL
ncbi:hypothetical protein D3C75_383840 [compost metagenome]